MSLTLLFNLILKYMNIPARISAWLIGVLVVPSIYLHGQSGPVKPDLALVGAKIYPSPDSPPIADGTVLIRDGKIVAVGARRDIKVPASDSVIDCKGFTLTAAFWNCHVHFIEPKWQGADGMPAGQFNQQMEQMITSHGFAHVYDIAEFNIENVLLIRNRIKKGDVNGPVIYTTGVPLVPPNGSPFYIAPLKLPEAGDAQQAINHVLRQIDSGADAVKIWTGSPTRQGVVYMPPEIVRQITATAHGLGKPVFAHPTDTKGVMTAVENGVDILAHTSPDDGRRWSADTIRKMVAAHVALIPTLQLWKDELIKGGVTDWAHHPLLVTAKQQLHDFENAGGTVLFGTDVGYLPDYATVDEYRFLSEAGLDLPRILAMLTTTPAQRFGLSNRTGRIVAGMDADIVLLKADPAVDMQALDQVAYTILGGRVIYRSPGRNSR
jgi:imidazolonepropionase-like amidohydrolase